MDVAAELASLVRSIAHSLVVVTDDSLGDESSEVVVRVPADTLDSQGNVGSAHGVVADADIGTDEVSLLLGKQVGVVLRTLAGKTGEVLLSQLDKLLMGNATSTNQDHTVGSVVVLDVVDELGAGDVADVLAGTKNGAAQSLVLESSGVQVVKDDLLNLLLNLLGLPQDDVAFTLDGRLLELGVLQDVGEDVNELRNVGVEGLSEVDGVLALFLILVESHLGVPRITTNRSVGVQVAAEVLNLELQLVLRALGSSLIPIISLVKSSLARGQFAP